MWCDVMSWLWQRGSSTAKRRGNRTAISCAAGEYGATIHVAIGRRSAGDIVPCPPRNRVDVAESLNIDWTTNGSEQIGAGEIINGKAFIRVEATRLVPCPMPSPLSAGICLFWRVPEFVALIQSPCHAFRRRSCDCMWTHNASVLDYEVSGVRCRKTGRHWLLLCKKVTSLVLMWPLYARRLLSVFWFIDGWQPYHKVVI